jgi:hypothetical protein
MAYDTCNYFILVDKGGECLGFGGKNLPVGGLLKNVQYI